MKKLLLFATWLASVSAYALPTYEPFTEFAATLASNPTNLSVANSLGVSIGTNANPPALSNCLDLATGSYTAPDGERWSSLNFSGTGSSALRGIDVAIISNATIFTQGNLSSLLPSTFPGMPATGEAITNFVENSAQPTVWNGTSFVQSNYVGNSAVLTFASDITRPTNGLKTLYFSYLFSVAQQGQLGTGNDGRYIAFLASSNLVEGPGAGHAFTAWSQLFNVFSTAATNIVHYFGHGLLQNGTSFFIGACNSSAGKDFSTSPFTSGYNQPNFIVGAYTFTSTPGVKDTNTIWVNPSSSTFGGLTPPSSPVQSEAMPFNMSDIGGVVLINRVGNGASGGVGTNYIANLIIGNTWSYVTGGPEFTAQPVSINTPVNANVNLNSSALAAGQTILYQWQRVIGNSTNNVTDGPGGAGGTATISGSTGPTLTFSGISAGDLGSYQVVVTASSTGFSLTSSNAVITSDPSVTSQPQSTVANFGGQASFSASVNTTHASLSYNWLDGSTPLTNGLQADGSTISGAVGTVSGGSNALTLTLTNVSYLQNGHSYTLFITNNVDNSILSSPATLTVNDPIITNQPVNDVVAPGGVASFGVGAAGSPTLGYQWSLNGVPLSDGPTITGSTISGSTTANLTISTVSDADAGNYSVNVLGSNSGQNTNSANAVLFIAHTIVVVSPPMSLIERAGDHVAFAVGATGNGLNYQWQFNGNNIPGATNAAVVLTNIQDASNGTYAVTITNLVSTNSASGTLTVLDSATLPVSSTNIIVARVGDGAQPLSGATGNTIYLDQYTTNGTYVSTIQIPDEGNGQPYLTGSSASVFNSPALLAQGAGADAVNSTFLTLSGSNQQYLNLAAYCQQYPFSGADVTIATASWRGLATINAFGIYNLAYTNSGFDSGGNHTVRSMTTLEGTNFWVTGQAGANGLKFANKTVASYANGNGVPTIISSGAGSRVVEVVGTNLFFTDVSGGSGAGIYTGTNGLPEPNPSVNSGSLLYLPENGQPNDFAFSPDGQTVYIADGQTFAGTNAQSGGIERWDTNVSGGWTYSYSINPINNGTLGAQGLAVYFPPNITTWGAGVMGAVIYTTTYAATNNTLSVIVDNGPASPATVITTAGPNTALRGVRFGPSAIPVSILAGPKSQTNFPANSVTFTATANGSLPLFYQWQFNGTNIPGATNTSFTTNNISFASSGNYSVTVTNLVPSSVTSNAVLTVTAGAPTFVTGVQSYNERAGDHLAFAAVVNGTLPLNAQWYLNNTNNPIPNATNFNLVLTNIQTSQSGTYILVVANIFGTNQSSGALTVTASPAPLSSNNLVVARIGDGVQTLSGATGNTLYLDQYTTAGAYVSSIQIPDEGTGQPYSTGSASSATMPFGSPALLVCGGNGSGNDAAFQGLLTRSANGLSLNFAGYCDAYPFTGADLTVGANGGTNWRGIGSIDAFASYTLAYTNTGLYSGGAHQIHAAVVSDQTNFWTTGEAGSGGGIKYVNPSIEAAGGGGIPAIGGTAAGTRGINIVNGNLFFSDSLASPAGIYQFGGLPTAVTTPSLVLAETNSPMDFAVSPDNNTIYIADNSAFGGTNVSAGGIQRWDTDPTNGGYFYVYTLATGTGSAAGARGLTVDFSAQANWGIGTTGAKIYATTAEFSGNRLIKIVDNGAGSAATTIATAAANNTLSGVRFGPTALPVSIAAEPTDQVAVIGTGARFTVGAVGSPPLFYQWQFNGGNLTGATQSALTVSPAQAVITGTYTVIVSNLAPSSATSTPASISFEPILGFNTNGLGWSATGTAGSGLPVYQFNGVPNVVELTQGVANQASSTFYNYPLYVGGFLATWTYQVVNTGGTLADGYCFVLQNDPNGPLALGNVGGNLGYHTIANSAALEFNLFPNASGVGVGFGTEGVIGPKVDPSPVVLSSGDPIDVTVQYVNGNATLTLFDEVNSNTFTTNAAINIPAAVGGNQAYVGFTGSDGATTSTQTISNFVYVPLVGLVATPANANSLTLTWPVGVGGYTLQQNPSLGNTNWVPAANTVSVVNGANQATVAVTASNMFYRLVLP